MISTRSVGLVIDTVVCLTLNKWETVSGHFGGYLNVLEVYTEIESVGRTSMKIHIEAWTQRFQTYRREKVTDGTFTYVLVGDDGRPRAVPALEP